MLVLGSLFERSYRSRGQPPHAFSKTSFPFFWAAALCGIVALVVTIAGLQYRWHAQIRHATEVRMGADLESVMMNWHLDLYGEFIAICVALQVGPDSEHETRGMTICSDMRNGTGRRRIRSW